MSTVDVGDNVISESPPAPAGRRPFHPLPSRGDAAGQRGLLPYAEPVAGVICNVITPAAARRREWVGLLVALLVTALYAGLVFTYWAPASPGNNENGYLAGGRMFAQTLSTGFRPDSPYEFVGRMWFYDAESGVNYPKYPVGFAVLNAVCLWVLGGDPGGPGYAAAYAISPASATLAVLGMYLLARRFTSGYVAVLAMLVLGCSQVMLLMAVRPMAHAVGTCVVVWGLFFLIGWMQRGGGWRGMAGGFLLGYACMIRYSDGLLVLAVASAALFVLRWDRRRSYVACAIPCVFWAIPVATQVGFTYLTTGSLTGYDQTNESSGFGLDFLQRNWDAVTRSLSDVGLSFTGPLVLLGLAVLIARQLRLAIILVLACVPSVVLHGAYYFAAELGVQYARFFTTQLPPLVLLAAIGLDALMRWRPGERAMVAVGGGVAVAIGAALGSARAAGITEWSRGPSRIVSMPGALHEGLNLHAVGREVTRLAPARSILLSDNGDMSEYLQGIGDWQLFALGAFEVDAMRRSIGPDDDRDAARGDDDRPDPNPIDPARRAFLANFYADRDQEQVSGEFTVLIETALKSGRRVFVVGDQGLRDRVAGAVNRREGWVLQPRARVTDLPFIEPSRERVDDDSGAGPRRPQGGGSRGPQQSDRRMFQDRPSTWFVSEIVLMEASR